MGPRPSPIHDAAATRPISPVPLNPLGHRGLGQGADAVGASILNVMSEGIIVLAEGGAVIASNPAAHTILGLSPERLRRPGWWSGLHPRATGGAPFAPGRSPGATARRENRALHDARVLIRRGDGEDRIIAVNYEPVRGGDPFIDGAVVVSFRDITEASRAQERLQTFAAVVALSDDLVAIAAPDGRLLHVNAAGRQLVGLPGEGDIAGLTIRDLLSDPERAWYDDLDNGLDGAPSAAAGTHRTEGCVRHRITGEVIPVALSAFPISHPADGRPWAAATIARDLRHHRRVIAELVSSQERYEAQFRALPLPTYIWERRDGDFVLVRWSDVAEQATAGALGQLGGARASEMYHDLPEVPLAFERCWSTRTHFTREMEYRMRSTGETRHLIITYAWLPPDHVLVHTLDVTDRVLSERRLVEMAERDDLTGLTNRRHFEQRLDALLGHRDVAVLLVDIDHFKFVNDSLGHGVGDDLLREVSAAMRARLRDTDVLSRFGGDEFAILLDGAGATGVSVTASVGVAAFASGTPISASDAKVAADIALYEAKQNGRDRVAVYSGHAGQSLTWLEQIRQAIAHDRLLLYGQPVLDLTGRVAEPIYELLVRMRGERGEIIAPSSFLPTAEQFGIIRDIDTWVLQRGIAFAARGNRVSINLSARSLGDPGLPARVAGLLDGCGARPEFVTFEFTETAAVSSLDEARACATALGRLGCATALDDFGTGFGTLTLLKHVPVRALKIDREFVAELATSAADQRIVRTIVQMAREADLITVAEGVEDAAALALLRSGGVHFAQGFQIARPAPLPE